MSLEIDGSAYAGAGAALRDLEAIAAPALEGALTDTAHDAEAAVRRRAARHHVTGALESGIHTERTAGELRVVAGGPIAPIIVGGSRAHLIRPVRARALAIEPHAEGRVLRFAGEIHHPGTAPDPFVADALDEVAGDAGDRLEAAGDVVTGALAGEIERRA